MTLARVIGIATLALGAACSSSGGSGGHGGTTGSGGTAGTGAAGRGGVGGGGTAGGAGGTAGTAGAGGTGGTAGAGGTAGTGGAGGAGGTAGSGGTGGATGGRGGATGGIGGSSGTGGGGTGGAGGSGGTAGGGGNNTFGTAAPITVGAGSATTGTLPDPMNSKDYYSFAGTKGETIQITASTSSATGFDPAYPNLVVVLYNASQTQIALDDDPWPRVSNAPNLWTVLPATGMYFILVEECNAAFGASFCGAASAITNHGYSVRVRDVGGATAIPEGSEPGNSAGAGAAPVTYTKAGTAYAPLLLYGLFQTAGDVDMYTFTVPADAAVPPGARARADFWIQPSGSNGDGSASPPGTIFVVDPATNASSVSQIDDASYGNGHTASAMPARLSVPVVLGKQYLLSVSYAQATAASDFYFVQHFGGADPAAPLLEQEPNDAFALADTLSAIDNLNGTFTFQIDGDLAPAGIDIDVHKLTIAPGLATISGACQARRLGSGLSGLTYSLLQSDAVTVIATQTESATSDLQIAATPVSAGAVYLKVSASAQVANVTDSSYICKFLAKP